jgi:hypothetical protein
MTKMPKDKKHKRRVLNLLGEGFKVIAKEKNLKSYEKKAKRVRELLKFTEEELEEREDRVKNLLKFSKEELEE